MHPDHTDRIQESLHEAGRALAWAVAQLVLGASEAEAREGHSSSTAKACTSARWSVEGAIDQVTAAAANLDAALAELALVPDPE